MFPNNLTPEFNLDAMRRMAFASSTAYCKPSEIRDRVYAAGANYDKFIDTGWDTQCFVAANDTDVVVAFRGTESIKDWVTDCKFFRRKVGGFPGEIHDGFGDAFYASCQQLREALWDVMQNRRIWVTGHSLGGALATLAAYDIVRGGKEISGCYTFGQPRVGNPEFASNYDSNPVLRLRTFRLVHENDIVPRVPGLLIGYRHCGRELFLDSFGHVDVDPSIRKKLLSDVWGIAAELHKGTKEKAVAKLVTDHFMDRYLERVNA